MARLDEFKILCFMLGNKCHPRLALCWLLTGLFWALQLEQNGRVLNLANVFVQLPAKTVSGGHTVRSARNMFNKTGDFVDSKTEDELDDLVKLVKFQRGKSKSIANDRKDNIQKYWKSKQDASAKAMADSRKRALNKKENLINDIVETGLLQTGEQVDKYMNSECRKCR